ncbi:hypothetical protein PGO13_20025 [Klebsiella aerogenes]
MPKKGQLVMDKKPLGGKFYMLVEKDEQAYLFGVYDRWNVINVETGGKYSMREGRFTIIGNNYNPRKKIPASSWPLPPL